VLLIIRGTFFPSWARPVLDISVVFEVGFDRPPILVALDSSRLPPKLAINNGISDVACFHIFIDLCDWQNIVDVIIVYDVCQHPHEDCKRAVLEIG
jgi:hypothetical protein